MSFGVDYSQSRPSIQVLKKYGVTFVCRYIAALNTSYNITKSELEQLTSNGFEVVFIFEQEQYAPLGGFATGQRHAKLARDYLHSIGVSRNSPIYFAIDFETTVTNIEVIKEYFKGINDIHSVVNTGAYGSYYTCRTLTSYGLVAFNMQTYAWSSGQWLNSAQIRQEKNGVNWPNAQVDYDSSHAVDFGQHPRPRLPIIWNAVDGGYEMDFINPEANGPAIVLGVPAKAKTITFRADPGFRSQTQPSLRVAMRSPWEVHTVHPNWENPAVLPCAGMEEISIARLDAGRVPISFEFG